MECSQIRRRLWAEDAPMAVAGHLETCDACRVESARARQLKAALGQLRLELAAVPPELEEALLSLAARERFGRARTLLVHPRFWRGAAVGAAAAATAAVGVIVARRLVRPDLVA